jgi:hypothetical protein
MIRNRKLADKPNKPVFTVLNGFSQSSLPFNLIKIDRGVFLAPKGAPANRVMSIKHAGKYAQELMDCFELWMIATGRITGKRRLKSSYLKAVLMLLANAKTSYEAGGQVVIGRRNGDKGSAQSADNPAGIAPRITNPILDYMADQGLIDYTIGKNNENDSNSSWFITLPTLYRHLKSAEIRAANGGQVVVCRERKEFKGDNPPVKPWSQMTIVQREVKRLSKGVDAYNLMMSEHAVTLSKRELLTHTYRSFTHSIDLGGRFYSPWQNTPKADRHKLRIDGRLSVEMDYKSLHWMMVYANAGLQFPLDQDAYKVDGYSRDTIKTVSLVLLNTNNLHRLGTQITQSGTAKMNTIQADWEARLDRYEQLRIKGLRANRPEMPKCLRGYIEGVPLGTNGKDLVGAILERHKPVAHLLGANDIGLGLQRQDSDIMADCLADCVADNIPALPLHDSIICKSKDKGLVYGIMATRYEQHTGQKINIKEVEKPIKVVKKTVQKVISESLFQELN